MENQVELTINKITLESIKVSLNPPLIDLQKSDLMVFLNGASFNDYNIFDESEGKGIIYRLVPNICFTPYDTLDMQIIKYEDKSDKIKIFFAKYFFNGNTEIDFRLPETAQGQYVIKLMTVNERDFIVSSDVFVVSMPVDGEMSYANIDKKITYFIEENINLNIYLFTIEGTIVPNGKYEIEVELVK